MRKIPDPEFIDDENPELDEEFFKNARPAREFFTDEEWTALLDMQKRYRGQRGAQKAPKKVRISFRLQPDTAEALRANGKGMNARVEAMLRAQLGLPALQK